jgi:hypothetical protein
MEYTNNDLTSKVDLLQTSVADVFPLNIVIEPSAGTVANNLDTYVDVSTGIGTLFIKVGDNWLSFDVSILV